MLEVLFFITLITVSLLLASLVAKGNTGNAWRVIRSSVFVLLVGSGLLLYAETMELTLIASACVLLGGGTFISALGFRK